MRKEILWAAGIGITFGLIIAFGVWRINSTLKPSAVTTQQTPTPTDNSSFKITLDKPENDDVVTDSSVSVSGITKPLAWITVSGEQDDYIIQADEQGVFLQDVNLIPGVNQIKVTAFDPQGNQSVEKVLVVYSSSFQAATVATPAPSASSSSDNDIRQKVQEKVAEALNKPKAFIGTVTDITDSTIQIKSSESAIKQISIDAQLTTVVRTQSGVSKSVKTTDIAIGDFIVAMGYVNSSSVLNAQRILITDPITEPKIDSTIGKVTDTSKKNITVTGLKDGTPVTVVPDSKTDIESFSQGKLALARMTSIGSGDEVIYILDSSNTTPTVRAIFIIQKAQS